MAESRSRGSGRPTKPNPLEEILRADQIEVPVVEVVGDFFDNVRFVSSTTMAGLLGFARLQEDDRNVLIPFVETRIEGGTPAEDGSLEPQPLFRGVLSLENAAFLTVNLASDMRSACEELATLSGGIVQVERKRLEQARFLLASTVREAVAATSKLTAILDSYAAEPASEQTEETQAPSEGAAS